MTPFRFVINTNLGNIAVTLGGTFHLSVIHLGSLFTLVVDYVGVTYWYWLLK